MDMLSISKTALERARTMSPELARIEDEAARAAIHAAVVVSSRREESTDRVGAPQTLVWLGRVSISLGPARDLGVAVIKGEAVVTILDAGAARQALARANDRRSAPALQRTEGPEGVLRFRAIGWPGVAAVDVRADGTAHVLRLGVPST